VLVHPDLSVMTRSCLPTEIAGKVIAAIVDHGLDCWLYTDRDWFVHNADAPHVAREQWTVKFAPVVAGDFTPHLEHAIKLVGVGDDYDAVARCEASVQHDFGSHVSAARSQPYYLDVTHPDANKGHVVEVLSQALSVPLEQIATIGDMPNDVLMFQKSGLSIAMGNASTEVQGQARFVTASNEDEGFAKAMETYVLGERVLAGTTR
jgi:Cof subfamily protein (haloacid dehalogenase superfamily)